MKYPRGLFLFALMLFCSTAVAQDSAASLTPKEQLERLAEQGTDLGMQALMKSGQVYPFGQIILPNGDVRAVGKQKGDEPQPADEWSVEMFNQLHALAENGEIQAASLTRLHEAKNKSGETVRGLWTLVDHKEQEAHIIFIPLVKQENGKHKPGKPIHRTTDERIFGPLE